MAKKQASPQVPPLPLLFAAGRDLPLPVWAARLQSPSFLKNARRLVWQSTGRRFVLQGRRCEDISGAAFEPSGPVSLAHPAELDAEEILYWRGWLRERALVQPFRQMGEPVVLKEGRLPGAYRPVESAGGVFEMADRYGGCRLRLSAMPALEKEGFRFVCRYRWDEEYHYQAEVELVNVVTPAGVLYACTPDQDMEELEARKGLSLALRFFYPFPGVRIRTLNHVAAVLEDHLLSQCAARDDLDMLLPHLPGMEEARMQRLLSQSPEGSRTRALIGRVLSGKEAAPC
ncbi:MAG: DUF4132 domain-containing protein [Clostridia bacterium]|nr:DUF4132 domain-containing protein [Clostridia bacterium]